MKSKIFTDKQLKVMKDIEKGKINRSDPTGIFYGKIKPKIVEILNVWFPKKKNLKKLVGDRR